MSLDFGGFVPLSTVNWHGRAVAILASLEEAADGVARGAASRGIGAEERQIGGGRV